LESTWAAICWGGAWWAPGPPHPTSPKQMLKHIIQKFPEFIDKPSSAIILE